MWTKTLLCGTLALAVGLAAWCAEVVVVVRSGEGRFVRADDNGVLRADQWFPGDPEKFRLIPLGGDKIAFKTADGYFLGSADDGSRRLRVERIVDRPGVWESFLVTPVGGNRAGLKTEGSGHFVRFEDGRRRAGERNPPEGPRPEEIVEIYRFREVPSSLCALLDAAIEGLVVKELGEQEYTKVRREETDRYVTLPAPTLNNLKRKKRHQVLGITEEFHVRARLRGPPEIEISGMAYLIAYCQDGSALLLFSVDARLPVGGEVSYKIPALLSATTGYRTTVVLSIVGEISLRTKEGQVSLGPVEVRKMGVSLQRLDISNDLLQTVRRAIQRTINGELRKNNARIRAKANEELAEAVQLREFNHPLLKYLAFPRGEGEVEVE